MASQELRDLSRVIPFSTNGDSDPFASAPGGADVMVLRWIGAASNQAPGYWSTARDIWLRSFYIRSDYLKIAVATFVQKAYAVPLQITARDHSVKAHVALAEQLHDDIMRNSGLLKGLLGEFAKFATDYATQDNGAFMLVMGGGKADGPIVGSVVGLMHLDSQHCTRTGNPEYPVVYEHTDGKRYKLHYTRVIFLSSMPSADANLYDVGLCAVSRCIDAAQDMLDVMVYQAEKFGSRPARQILYGKTGITLKQMNEAIALANTRMDSQGLDRFSRTVLMAPASPTGALDLDVLDLAKAPDGFDRQQSTILDMAVIAGAFGLDLRDLAHSLGLQGQTKADAEVQHMKTRGKGVEQFLMDFAEQLNQKVLPETLEAYFDYIDDTQDKQAADIAKVRAEGRQIDINSDVVTVRVAREQMLENGEIDETQFEDMELAEGRLSDGLDVLMLFQSQDSEIRRILDFGIENPLDVAANGATITPQLIDEHVLLAWQRHDAAPNANIKRKMRQALAALDKLRTLYQAPQMDTEPAGDEQPAEDEPSADAEQPTDEELKAAEPVTPRGRSVPAVPDEDAIAADAEANADEAMHDWDTILPDYAGLLDAVFGKKKEIKQSDRFTYDERSFRYRDSQTGRFISESTIKTLAGQYENARQEVGRELASQLVNKQVSLSEWVTSMRSELRNTYSAEYMLGRGGRNAMTSADWGNVGNMLKKQYGFLNEFANEIAAGKLTEAQIAARAQMYFNSATQAYERGKVHARGMPDLPAYPGDGTSECRANCKCSWDIRDTKTAWECTWALSAAEHCPTCIGRASDWAPLIVPKE